MDNRKKKFWMWALTTGAALAVVIAPMNIISMKLLGSNTNAFLMGFLNYGLPLLIVILMGKRFTRDEGNLPLTYGRALGMILVSYIFTGMIVGIILYFYYNFISRGEIEEVVYNLLFSNTELLSTTSDTDAMNRAYEIVVGIFTNPVSLIFFMTLGMYCAYIINALIAALIIKRDNTANYFGMAENGQATAPTPQTNPIVPPITSPVPPMAPEEQAEKAEAGPLLKTESDNVNYIINTSFVVPAEKEQQWLAMMTERFLPKIEALKALARVEGGGDEGHSTYSLQIFIDDLSLYSRFASGAISYYRRLAAETGCQEVVYFTSLMKNLTEARITAGEEYIFTVTFDVPFGQHEDWLKAMEKAFLPNIKGKAVFSRLMSVERSDGFTYSLQIWEADKEMCARRGGEAVTDYELLAAMHLLRTTHFTSIMEMVAE